MNAAMNAIPPTHEAEPAAASSAAMAMLWQVISFTHAQLQTMHVRDMAVLQEEIRLLEAGEPLPRQRRDPTLATCRLVRSLCEAVTLHTHLLADTLPARRPRAVPPAPVTSKEDPRRDVLRTALRQSAGLGRTLPSRVCRAIDQKVEECLAADPNGALPLKAVFEAMRVDLGFPVDRGAPAKPAEPAAASPPGWRAPPPGSRARAILDEPLPFPPGAGVTGATACAGVQI